MCLEGSGGVGLEGSEHVRVLLLRKRELLLLARKVEGIDLLPECRVSLFCGSRMLEPQGLISEGLISEGLISEGLISQGLISEGLQG